MIKEELEKEADEYANKHWGASPSVIRALKQTYLASAEPREKRIADLESTNKKISDECHKLVNTLEKKQNKNELLETQNIKLQAEVSRLTIENAELEAIVRNTKAVDESFALQTIQLTKAKDHIKKLLDCLEQDTNDPETNYYVCQYMDEAEQFLKESEVNNALS